MVPIPDYCFVEHFMNQANPDFLDAVNKGDHRSILSNPGYRNGHALSFFMEQYRNLLVWEDGTDLWLAKATPRHWLQQAKRIAVSRAPTYFGEVAYVIISDVEHGRIQATVELPSRKTPHAVLLRLRHPEAAPIKYVTVNGNPWTDFDTNKEVIVLEGLAGKVTVQANY